MHRLQSYILIVIVAIGTAIRVDGALVESSDTLTGTDTSASAAINGSGVATNDSFDTFEAYQGAVISQIFSTGISGSTVVENANVAAFEAMAGNSSFLLSGTSTGTSVLASYNYANDIVALVVALGSAEAKLSFLITLEDSHGHTIDANPAELSSPRGLLLGPN